MALQEWSYRKFRRWRASIAKKKKKLVTLYEKTAEEGVMEAIHELEKDKFRASKENDEELMGILKDYFGDIFKTCNPLELDLETTISDINAYLIAEDRLGKLFMEENVYRALKDMGPTKAPGPNGFHAIFYQKN